ncbi:MAG: glycosyltransferase [Anaerolineales bacterium]
MNPKADFVIEFSHDIANPVGGVYAVMASKARALIERYGNNYYTVGPYYYKHARNLLEEEEAPAELSNLIDELKESYGIACHYGRWLVPGRPQTFLLDSSARLGELDAIKEQYARQYGIDFPAYDQPLIYEELQALDIDTADLNLELLWAESARFFIKGLLGASLFEEKTGVLHYNFYDPSVSVIVDLRRENTRHGLVATCHGVKLAAELSERQADFYDEAMLAYRQGKTIAEGTERQFGPLVTVIHQIEKRCVESVDVFTTVSEVTSINANYLLGREADLITPNGIDMSHYPTVEQIPVAHDKSRRPLARFLDAYFLPYYNIDSSNALIFLMSGRHEFRNKGYDVFIDALGVLNERLRKEKSDKTIFVLLFSYEQYKQPGNQEVIENLVAYERIRRFVYDRVESAREELLSRLLRREETALEDLLGGEFFRNSQRLLNAFDRPDERSPPLSALRVEQDDAIYRGLMKQGFENRPEDRVKIIYYPMPVSVDDGFLSMSYIHALTGADVGVFPSAYEPWGYTPQEAAACGLIAITTDTAGFGAYVNKEICASTTEGIHVIHRRGRTHQQVVEGLADSLSAITRLSAEQRAEQKMKARQLAKKTDWKYLIDYYIRAHNLALERAKARQETAPVS